ncbi:hypothetical protein DM02DRAFT_701991 [Periconia macrospinosa]|uniref:Uncharacterized protein n=1 Tax=Periconia macrospinosa TaxID=97972 RepID=A0A2V1D1T8_9PLEO|nr:hypothetical protein DM02DRAFT_701991 [Periconia macrospinosa]
MDAEVHTGIWINHSLGPVAGTTITLPLLNGYLLVSALSLFFIAVGSRFWKILSFVSHQLNATQKATDVQHHQHQAILRNAETSVIAAKEFFVLPFARRRGFQGSSDFRRSALRSWGWTFLALVNLCVWPLLALFSSYITYSAEDDVLIRPGACGIVSDNSSASVFPKAFLNRTVIADVHARNCYRDNASSTSCHIFVRTPLPRSIEYYLGDVESLWYPSQEFYRTDANLALIWLFPNHVLSLDPIDDPFFGFHATNSSKELTFYEADNLVNVMACSDQGQLCNVHSQGFQCTSLTSVTVLEDEYFKLGLNPTQEATVRLITNLTHEIDDSIGGRGISALLASEMVMGLVQDFLPKTQWMAEVRHWFSMGLVNLQYELAKYAIGPPSPLPKGVLLQDPQTPQELNLCRSMKLPNPGQYQSFSILGLSTIFGVGALIIITSLIIEPLAHHAFTKFSIRNDFRRRQWSLDGKLQLQRMAYEHVGIGLDHIKLPTISTQKKNDKHVL